MNKTERRFKRSVNTTRALCLQLKASVNKGQLDGMVLADDEGVCLAAAGDTDACQEIAAQLPLVGRKVPQFAGVLFGDASAWDIAIRRIELLGSELYLCAIGDSLSRQDQLERSVGGVSRILLPKAA